MKIIVLIKQVLDTGQITSSDDIPKLMAGEGTKIVNPWDEYALEAGIQLKEEHGGQVTVLSLGPPEATEALKRGLAMGADEAILLSDPAFAGGDSLATARVLAAAIKKIGDYDIILAGRAGEDRTMAVPTQVAVLLGLPPVSYVAALQAVDPAAKTLTAVRLMEGRRETVRSPLPALVSVVKEINEPRYPSFINIRKASKKDIPHWGLSDLGLAADEVGQAGSQLQWPETKPAPTREAAVELIEGSPAEAAHTLVDKLIEDNVIH